MISKISNFGTLDAKLIRAKKAPWKWRLRNTFRWQYLKAWFAIHIAVPIAKKFGLMTVYGKLEARLIRADGAIINYGILGWRVVTSAFVNEMVDQLISETSTWGDFKYHDSGVGGTSENITDTDIETTDGEARVAGTQVEDDPNDYQSVATIDYTTSKAIVEHGLFNALTVGILMDRTVFTVINVDNGDSIQFTYTLTCTAGS